jgi:stress-induced-phosphoprotein 1
MLMQVMQMDPRFTDVFSELTGVDLNAMKEQKQKHDAQQEVDLKKAEEERKKREAEEAARKKAEEEAALPSEERMKLQAAKDAEAKKQQGNEFYKKKDFTKALELYNQAVELNPQELLFYTNIAACYIEQKMFAEAIAECDKAIELTKGTNYDFVKLAKVLARKASAYEKSGDLQKA